MNRATGFARSKHLRTVAVILAVVCMLIALFNFLFPLPRLRYENPVFLLTRELRSEYLELGLEPPTDIRAYYSSTMGFPFRCFGGKVKLDEDSEIMQNIRYRFHYQDVWPQMVWTITADVQGRTFFGRPTHRHLHLCDMGVTMAESCKAEALLRSVSAGTGLWKQSLIKKGDYAILKPGPIPPITFGRPGTQKQLDEYWQWLLKMAGPEYRFRDDWGNAIKLSIGGTSDAPIFTVSGAGPDGKWGTKDDMILKVDARTGQTVAKVNVD